MLSENAPVADVGEPEAPPLSETTFAPTSGFHRAPDSYPATPPTVG
jgi:hypothetical protein